MAKINFPDPGSFEVKRLQETSFRLPEGRTRVSEGGSRTTTVGTNDGRNRETIIPDERQRREDPRVIIPDEKLPKEDPDDTVRDPLPENPCLDLYNLGHVLWDYKFQWKEEVKNFMLTPNVKKISAFSDISLEYILEHMQQINPKIEYKIICSKKYIKDYLCNIKSVKYTKIPTIDIAIANFKFTDEVVGLNGYYYVTSHGELCRIIPDPGFETSPPIDTTPPPVTPPKAPLGSGQVFLKLNPDSKVVLRDVVTGPLWTNNQKYLATPSTSSILRSGSSSATITDSGSLSYCLDVYNESPDLSICEEVQFSIIYADYDGKGSKDLGGLDNETLTKAMYTQYAHILLPYGQEKFEVDGVEQDYVYILDVKRDRYRNVMDPGNWQLSLASGSFPETASFALLQDSSSYASGSITLIDTSAAETGSITFTNKTFNVRKGTIEDGLGYLPIGSSSLDTSSYGLFYPNHGVIVLSGTKLDSELVLNTNRSIDSHGYNTYRLFESLEMVTANSESDASGDPLAFWGRYVDLKYETFYYVRVGNAQFNYSNNITYQESGSEGKVIPDFVDKEMAYFTSVGLYNPNKELMAIGKLSKPLISSCTEESLFTVKVGHG